jgi:aryl-alcohol dehydrogenase-like predicted oxidoreductase
MATPAKSKMRHVVAQRTFGKTGLEVGILGLGAAPIGCASVSDLTLRELLGIAADSGMNVIDTAAMYGDSEDKLGRALRGIRKQFLLFTKCGRLLPSRLNPTGFLVRFHRRLRRSLRLHGQPESLDWDPRVLKANIEQSLRRLKTEYIDVIQLHTCSEATLRRGDVVDVLDRVRESGKARYIGYTGDNSAAIYAVECGRFDSVQVSVNIADQQALDIVLTLAAERGVGVVAKRPIANSLWMSPTRPDLAHYQVYWNRLQQLRYEFLLSDRAHELALRFTLSAPLQTGIVGTTNPAHLLRNVEYAMAGPLSSPEFEEIRARWKHVATSTWIGQT